MYCKALTQILFILCTPNHSLTASRIFSIEFNLNNFPTEMILTFIQHNSSI